MRAKVQGGMVSYQAHATVCTDLWVKDPTGTTENPKASSTVQTGKGGPWPGFALRTLPRRKEGRRV